MADVRQLLIKAVPRLEKGDGTASRLEAKLVKRAGSLWNRGRRRLKKLGIEVAREDYREIAEDEDFLDAVRGVLGDKQFVRFVRKVKEDLAQKLAEKKGKAPRESRRMEEPPKKKKKKRPEPKPEAALTISSQDDGDEVELALPDDDDMELALPDDDDDLAIPVIGEPEDLELDLDNLELIGAGGGGDALELKPEPVSTATSSDPAQAGEQCLSRYRKTGEADALKDAKKHFKRAAKDPAGPVAEGAARGGLALAYLLGGELDKAKEQAKRAVKLFSREPVANSVLCRVGWPREADRARLSGLLLRAAQLLSKGDHAGMTKLAREVKKAFPKQPYSGLIELAAACDGREPDLTSAILKAWKAYPPSPELADVPLGIGLERAIARGCLDWLQGRVESEGGDVLARTVRDVDKRDNAIAGAFQIPLGVSRTALAVRDPGDSEEKQELLYFVARSLFSAQYYDNARDVFGRARSVDRESSLLADINKGETQCGVMRRSFDKPGVKNKTGKLEGAGARRLKRALKDRLEIVRGDLEGDRAKLEGKETTLLEAILGDAKRRKKLQAKAKAADQTDPFAGAVELIEQGASGKKAPAAPKGGGLFGRVKAGMKGALDKAKSAVTAGKRREALKALGERLRDRPDGGWKDAELDKFLDQLDQVEPRLDFLDEQATALTEALERAGKT